MSLGLAASAFAQQGPMGGHQAGKGPGSHGAMGQGHQGGKGHAMGAGGHGGMMGAGGGCPMMSMMGGQHGAPPAGTPSK
ncbi:MAG: hypothetical protein A3G81_13630 [Betaproteobacteria bacterium RIFCSPLOWO2_12_FULL_65_14]|nr:MAG: hypothetical protein A3G81_13630 [Betaproteobacteria bacterium RIFCSPLOWO2_12_FULL_65_14]